MTHTSTEQPEALRLADICATKGLFAVEDELRRLHTRVQELEASQAQRVPLPLSEILHFAGEHGFVNIQGDRAFCAFVDGTDVAFELEALARDIERAHGITQEKQG
ncbi:hypothetical protein N5C12_16245 [Comamonas aquatica]|uniref:hypothetical protein n=1 Tax=Comamonas aquatica TaxID=225991 RepID=UPI00244B9A72|nr:hypothetical protein [Comamonas aquatica]MDH0900889.1 hypothetical protein [Comamonas aquatica]